MCPAQVYRLGLDLKDNGKLMILERGTYSMKAAQVVKLEDHKGHIPNIGTKTGTMPFSRIAKGK